MSVCCTCSRCGTPLNNEAPDGFCPACMLEGALFLGKDSDSREPGPAFDLPQLGDYQLLEEIARGGMGVVYKARQISLNRIVAVKLILVGQFADKTAVRRFKTEASAAAKLGHPNIVAIHEIKEHAGQHFFSMEHVEGQNLAEFIRQRPVSTRDAAQLVSTIAEAVHYAHEQGIIHRDLKPSNILIDCFHAPHITDFGLARDLTADSELTVTGQVLGSPNYISPEQASGKTAGPASDIYALGAILYHLLSGRPPFACDSVTDTLQQVAAADPVSPRLLNPSLPRDLETICLKCLEKEPARRYHSAAALAEELDRFLKDEPIHARAQSAPAKAWRWCRRKPVVAGLAAAFVFSLTLGFVVSAWQASARKAALVETRRTLYIAQMQAVQQAWDRGDIAQAQSLLRAQIPKEGEEDLRGFEWRYYWRQCRDGSALTITNPFPKGILCIAASPDDSLVAWGDEGGKIELRRTTDLKPVSTGIRQTAAVSALDFSRDGRWLASGGGERLIRIWNVASGAEAGRILFTNELAGAVSSLRFSPDGTLLAAGDRPGRIVQVWDLEGKELVAEFTGPLSERRVVDFSPDGRRLVFNQGDSTIQVWHVEPRLGAIHRTTLVMEREFVAHRSGVGVLKYSSDGRLLASSGADGEIKLWATGNWTEVETLYGHGNTVTDIGFSKDGRLLVSSCVDRTIKVWDLSSKSEIKTFYGHSLRVHGLTVFSNAQRVVSAGSDYTVKFWDLPPLSDSPFVSGEAVLHGRIWFSRFSPDGRIFATIGADEDSDRRLWDTATGNLLATVPAHSHAHSAGLGAFSPDSRLFATASKTNGIAIWNAANGAVVAELSTGTNQMEALTFSRTGQLYAAGTNSGTVYRWQTPSFTQLPPLTDFEDGISYLSLSPSEEVLAVWCPSGNVWLRGMKSSAFLRLIPHANPVPAMAFSPDEQIFTTEITIAGQTGTDIWDIATGEKLEHLHGGFATFSPDGRFLAVAGDKGFIQLWDVQKRRLAQQLTWVGGRTHGISFSPDGKTLVTGDSWITLRFWNMTMFREVLTLTPKGGAHAFFSPDGNTLAVIKNWRANEILRAASWSEIEAELAAEIQPTEPRR